MTVESSEASETAENERRPVMSFSKQLSASGSGGGVSLHFGASFASEYGLDPDTEVEVNVVEKGGGDVAFEIANIPAGFTHDELVEFAERQNWKKTDEYVDPDSNEWYLTYRNGRETVRIEIDSEPQIDEGVVNNVVVQGNPVDVTDDYDAFSRLCAAAQRKDLRVRIDDSDGKWQRLKSFPESDTDDLPDKETFVQLSSASDTVVAQLICQRTSLNTTLEDLRVIVEAIESGYASRE